MKNHRLTRVIASTILAIFPVLCFAAKHYPSQPIRLVVPYPPGAGSDSVGRLLAQELAHVLNENVVVENQSGAGGSVGAGFVSKSKPDGYTLLLGNTGPNTIAPSVIRNLSYDIKSGFSPISVVATQPLFILVNKESTYKTFKDLVEAGTKKPGTLNFGSSGVGGLSHLAGEMINRETGAKFTHVPYRGGAAAMMAILSNEVVFHTPSAIDGVSQVKSGKMRALAVTSDSSWPATPDVPTVAQAGYPSLKIKFWYGLFAPSGTPPEIIEKLSKATKQALEVPEVKKKFADLGSVVAPSTPQILEKLIETDSARYSEVAKAANIQN